MGRDKAWISYQGQPLIARQIELVRSLGPVEVFVSGRADTDYEELGCPVVTDANPNLGPLAGILEALLRASADRVLVLAVDMPHMTREALAWLLSMANGERGVVPKAGGRLEPLAAVYPSNAAAVIERMLEHRLRAARAFAANCRRKRLVRFVSAERALWPCFGNWNAPHDVSGGRPPLDVDQGRLERSG